MLKASTDGCSGMDTLRAAQRKPGEGVDASAPEVPDQELLLVVELR